MMTFKQFYLQSLKGSKAPRRASRSFKSPRRQNEILDRIKKLKAVKGRSGHNKPPMRTSMSEINC